MKAHQLFIKEFLDETAAAELDQQHSDLPVGPQRVAEQRRLRW